MSENPSTVSDCGLDSEASWPLHSTGISVIVTPSTPSSPAILTPPLVPGAQSTGSEPGMLFFGASPGSGTTWLTGILNAHPEISCSNEGRLLTKQNTSARNWLNKASLRDWSRNSSSLNRGRFGKLLDHQALERAAQRGMIREVLTQAILIEGQKDYRDLKWMGDKTTTHYCEQVDFLHDIFPHARFLTMVRDGRDVCISDLFVKLRDAAFLFDASIPSECHEDLARAREHHVLGNGQPIPLFTTRTLSLVLDDWLANLAGLARAKALYGNQFREIRYEALIADPIRVAQDLFRWLGVSDDPLLVENLVESHRFEKLSGGRPPGQADPTAEWRKGIIGDWKNYFTSDDKQLFKRRAGALLIELGYEQTFDW